MEQLYVELTNQLWNKLLLRTHLKVRDALQLLIHSANSANAYGCALTARAILEHVALLQHFWDKVPWRKSRIISKDEVGKFTNQMMNLTLGSRMDWQNLFSGSFKEILASGQWERPEKDRIPHMAEIVKSIDDALFSTGRSSVKRQWHFFYGLLCDVVHPSWGGDFVYSPRMSFVVNPEPEFNSQFKLSATMFCLPVVELVKHLLQQAEVMAGEELVALM